MVYFDILFLKRGTMKINVTLYDAINNFKNSNYLDYSSKIASILVELSEDVELCKYVYSQSEKIFFNDIFVKTYNQDVVKYPDQPNIAIPFIFSMLYALDAGESHENSKDTLISFKMDDFLSLVYKNKSLISAYSEFAKLTGTTLIESFNKLEGIITTQAEVDRHKEQRDYLENIELSRVFIREHLSKTEFALVENYINKLKGYIEIKSRKDAEKTYQNLETIIKQKNLSLHCLDPFKKELEKI